MTSPATRITPSIDGGTKTRGPRVGISHVIRPRYESFRAASQSSQLQRTWP